MKQIIALAALVVASASALAFQPGMTTVQVNIEVAQRVAGGESLDSITAAANAAGVSPTVLQASLAAAGLAPAAVFNSMVAANYDAGTMLPPTAAGNNAGGANPISAPSFTGINSSSFGQSRASTVGGGGRTSVSGS
jgi:hypothetical protein